MQVVYKDKDEEGNSRGADSVDVIICARRISRHLKGKCLRGVVLQTQALRVGQVKEPCIGLTQENSIESSVQDSLPYIPRTHGPC